MSAIKYWQFVKNNNDELFILENEDTIAELISLFPPKAKWRSPFGQPPLASAVGADARKLTQALLANGAPVNECYTHTSPTTGEVEKVLYAIMQCKSCETLNILCDFGADLRVTTEFGRSVLWYIGMRTKDGALLKRLLELDAPCSVSEIRWLWIENNNGIRYVERFGPSSISSQGKRIRENQLSIQTTLTKYLKNILFLNDTTAIHSSDVTSFESWKKQRSKYSQNKSWAAFLDGILEGILLESRPVKISQLDKTKERFGSLDEISFVALLNILLKSKISEVYALGVQEIGSMVIYGAVILAVPDDASKRKGFFQKVAEIMTNRRLFSFQDDGQKWMLLAF